MALKKSKKPIIGHNMMYDILFTYEQFIGPLPDSYKKFATAWTNWFGELYDTKILARHIITHVQPQEERKKILSKTQLEHVYDKCDGS